MSSKRDAKRRHRKRRDRDRRRSVQHAVAGVRAAQQREKDRARLAAKIQAAQIDETVNWHMVEAHPGKVGELAEALEKAEVPYLRARETHTVVRRGRKLEVEIPVMGRVLFVGFPGHMSTRMVEERFRQAKRVETRPMSAVPAARQLAARDGKGLHMWPAYLEEARSQLGLQMQDHVPWIIPADDLAPFAGCLAGTIERDRPAEEPWLPGEDVTILEGPFASFPGVIEEVDAETGMLSVAVTIFGRAAPVQLEPKQVERTLQRAA